MAFTITLLHVGESKEDTQKLYQNCFKEEFLGELEKVLRNINEDLTIPYSKDFMVIIWDENLVSCFPIAVIEDANLFCAK